MAPETPQAASNEQPAQQMSREELARRVAQRVWELWQQELRLEHERRGRFRR